MKRKWKSVSALCLSALIGCLLPMSTMMAAEGGENVENMREAETDSSSENVMLPKDNDTAESAQDVAQNSESAEVASDTMQDGEVAEAADDTAQNGEVSEAADDTVRDGEASEAADDTTQSGEAAESLDGEASEAEDDMAQNGETSEAADYLSEAVNDTVEEAVSEAQENIPQVKDTAGAESESQTEKGAAPVIEIQLQGVNVVQALGGEIGFDRYFNNHDQRFAITVDQSSSNVSLVYYLDVVSDGSDESKNADQLAELWQEAEQPGRQEIVLGQDGKYVLYVKAVSADGQVSYARTDGVVVDATAPAITGINNGGTYPLGTEFGVTDENLDIVKMNEQPAASINGLYQVAVNDFSTTCTISAKDKAGNETVYTIIVEGKANDDDIRVITESGSYSLKAGTAYQLGSGSWTVDGDSSVYRGGSTFFVRENGSYLFHRQK